MIRPILVVLLLLINYNSHAQFPIYQRSLSNSDSSFILNDIVLNPTESFGVGASGNDGCWCSIAANGSFNWCYKFNLGNNNFLNSIIKINNFYYATGENGAVVKFDTNGNIIWAEKFEIDSVTRGIKIVNSGDTIYVAFYIDNSQLDRYSCIAKIDTNGVVSWLKKLNQPGAFENQVFDIDVGIDGSIVIAGASINVGPGSANYYMRWDSNGNVLWSRKIFTSALYKIKIQNSGKFYAAGHPYSRNYLQFDWSGIPIWANEIVNVNFGSVTYIPSLEIGANNELLALYKYDRLLTPAGDGLVFLMIDTNGITLNSHFWALNEPTFPLRQVLFNDSRHGFLAVGLPGTSNVSSKIIYADSTGQTGGCPVSTPSLYQSSYNQQTDTFSMPIIDTIYPITNLLQSAIPVSVNNNVLCSGITGINQILENPNSISLYPNPATNTIHLKWLPIKNENRVNIEIYDSKGTFLSSSFFENPISEINFNIMYLEPGFYFVKLTTTSMSYFGKFIKLNE